MRGTDLAGAIDGVRFGFSALTWAGRDGLEWLADFGELWLRLPFAQAGEAPEAINPRSATLTSTFSVRHFAY